MRISVVIPALNEREAVPRVLGDLPWSMLHEVVVADNGSTDGTAEVARRAGARVVREPRRGYGRACLSGIAALGATDVVVFLDGDHSDHPEELPAVADPILRNEADLVIGSRLTGERERGAMAPLARLGNTLSVFLIRHLTGVRYSDLGPFRAIRREALDLLDMRDEDFGWTVEMQVKAARAGLRVAEVPVRYRRRIGRSKISGTVRGTILAGKKILETIARLSRWRPARRAPEWSTEKLVTVVVPTWNEAEEIGGCLSSLARNEGPLEVLVVDGGSRDTTAEIAASSPHARVISSGRGRARQMNEGARRATGEVLWFLHADCRPLPEAVSEIRRALMDPWITGGAFRFAVRSPRPAYRLLETLVRFRCSYLREPYGDQGIFLPRHVFDSMGGYRDVPSLEDIGLVRRILSRGGFRQLEVPLPTSPRRWERHGILATTARFATTAFLDRLRIRREIPPHCL